jgi:hypothetical protein
VKQQREVQELQQSGGRAMRKKGRGGESRVDGSEMAGNPWTRPDLAAAVVAGRVT